MPVASRWQDEITLEYKKQILQCIAGHVATKYPNCDPSQIRICILDHMKFYWKKPTKHEYLECLSKMYELPENFFSKYKPVNQKLSKAKAHEYIQQLGQQVKSIYAEQKPLNLPIANKFTH